MSKMHDDVRVFHRKFDLGLKDKPGHLTKRELTERFDAMQGTLDKFVLACGCVVSTEEGGYSVDDPQDLIGQADALVGLVYQAMGAAVALGLPWDKLWDDVHRANMAKTRDKTGESSKLKTPEGWQAPYTEFIMHQAGYTKERPQPKEVAHADHL